ncbi:MAG: NAD(P)/FAD-dependent oxidoreductase [Vicinamibacterales bacterium]
MTSAPTLDAVDVVIVGAGPAGLSAALMLGRCRRSVLVVDHGKPRNARSLALHGYLTRDGIAPATFLQHARKDLAQYDTVKVVDGEAVSARCLPTGKFSVALGTGAEYLSRKLLLATGVVDNLPDIPGFKELYGTSVFHCPYCDGWEWRDQPMAIYGSGIRGFGVALEMTAWSSDLVLCTDGPSGIDADGVARLARNRIAIREERVARLEGRDGLLSQIVFRDGATLPRRVVFFSTGQYQRSDLLSRLGCEFNDKGTVRTGKYETTHLPGLYVCGDASRAVQWAVVAASEGAEAAFAINTDLIKENLK